MTETTKRLYRLKEAATYVGLGLRTIRRYVDDGSIPSIKLVGRRLIEKDDLDLWVRLHSSPKQP